jgi:hypothetical protein
MFARGLVSLHTPPLLGRKPSSVKSRVSISSKLIEIKGLHLYYFGHLRKTGGRGSYRLVHTAHLPAELCPHAPVRPSQRRTSPLPAVSANLSLLSAVDCRLSDSSSPLTPVFPPLARPTLNMPIFYILPTIGGRVPLVQPTCPERSRRAYPEHTEGSLPPTRKVLSPLRSTQACSQAFPAPLHSSPRGAKITTLLVPETFTRSSVSNT